MSHTTHPDTPSGEPARRGFLKQAVAAAGAAAAAAGASSAGAQAAASPQPAKGEGAAAQGAASAAASDTLIEHPGSDFMIDVIRTLNIDYISTNPGSSFRSLHESLVLRHRNFET